LEWEDLNVANLTLTINKALQHIPGENTFQKAPKTYSGFREISIPESLVKLLLEYQKIQKEERLKCGALWKNTNKIFCSWDGDYLYPYSPARWFKAFINKNNLPPLSFHQLRHTCASLMIAGNVDLLTVSRHLGHAQPSTTTNIYGHLIRKAEREAADKIEGMLVKGSKG